MITMLEARIDALIDKLPADLMAWAFMAAAAVSVLIVVILLGNAMARSRRHRQRRLDRVAGKGSGVRVSARRPLRSADHIPPTGLLRYLPRSGLLRLRLQRAGMSGNPLPYLGACFLVALLATLVMLLWGAIPPLACPLAGLAAGIILPHMTVGWLSRRRENAFLKNLPEGIDIIVRGLKAGLPVTESMEAVGREAVEPVAGMFRQISDLIRIGHSLESAIERIAKRMAVPELRFLAITMAVQRETGGNLTETLENLAEILRKRRQMQLKIRAVSSEARASAYILGSLPFVMFVIIYTFNRGYVMELFSDPRGHMMIGIGLGSIAAGVLVMAKMIRFDI